MMLPGGIRFRACSRGNDRLRDVKFERLLKVPRSARTIQVIVNIPEAPAPSVQEPAKRTLRNRIWAISKVAAPVIASAAAIVISVLSLHEQRQTDIAAATAEQRQEAEGVTYVQEPGSSSGSSIPVLVENLSNAPAVAPTLYIEADTLGPATGGPESATFNLRLADIPACSSATINVGPTAISVLNLSKNALATGTYINVSSMTFIDSHDLYWEYGGGFDRDGNPQSQLQQIVSLPASRITVRTQNALELSYKPAAGCA